MWDKLLIGGVLLFVVLCVAVDFTLKAMSIMIDGVFGAGIIGTVWLLYRHWRAKLTALKEAHKAQLEAKDAELRALRLENRHLTSNRLADEQSKKLKERFGL